MKWLSMGLAAYFAGNCTACLAAGPDVKAACVQVEGDRLRVADLLGAVPGWPEGALDPALELAYAPAPGTRRVLSAAQLEGWARAQGVSFTATATAAAGVCLERRMRLLTEAELLAAMRTALGGEDWQIEVRDLSRYAAPAGEIRFARSGLGTAAHSDPGQGVIWRGWVAYGEGRRFPVWARVRVTREQPRIVAAERLAAGRAIAAEQVREETRIVFPDTRAAARQRDDVVGRVPRAAIAAGSVVWPDALETPREVLPGGRVAVEVRQGRATVVLEGRAQAGGRLGDWITVRNPASGKIFRARITGPERAATP